MEQRGRFQEIFLLLMLERGLNGLGSPAARSYLTRSPLRLPVAEQEVHQGSVPAPQMVGLMQAPRVGHTVALGQFQALAAAVHGHGHALEVAEETMQVASRAKREEEHVERALRRQTVEPIQASQVVPTATQGLSRVFLAADRGVGNVSAGAQEILRPVRRIALGRVRSLVLLVP